MTDSPIKESLLEYGIDCLRKEVWVVLAEVKAPTLMTKHGALNNKISCIH